MPLKNMHWKKNHEFYVKCSEIEGEGYCQWPRLKGNSGIL